MEYVGTTRDGKIVLDRLVPFPDGTRVSVDVSPVPGPEKGSPEAILRLAGTLTDEEAAEILRVAQECRRIDRSLWKDER